MAGEKMAKAAVKTAGSSDENLFGALCYIIGVIVPLFVLFTEKKENKFLAFHAWQSLAYTVAVMVVWFGFIAVTMVAAVLSGGIGSFIGCLGFPLFAVIVLLALYAAYKAYQGEKFKFPVIGDFAEKQAMK